MQVGAVVKSTVLNVGGERGKALDPLVWRHMGQAKVLKPRRINHLERMLALDLVQLAGSRGVPTRLRGI